MAGAAAVLERLTQMTLTEDEAADVARLQSEITRRSKEIPPPAPAPAVAEVELEASGGEEEEGSWSSD